MNNKFQPINFEQLDEMSFGDDAFKKELIDIFLEQIPEFITNMKKYFAENDLLSLSKEAHTAKSSVFIFGMQNTGESLKTIQHLGEKEIKTGIPELLEKVIAELENADQELKVFLEKL